FIGTECRNTNLYMRRLTELEAEWAPKGVRFLAINSNSQDTAEAIKAHAKKHSLTLPVLLDGDGRIAERFGARRTPEAFVLDAQFKVRYQGRIDDQFGVGYQRSKPGRQDVVEALTEILAGKAVTQPATAVAGCKIARA